jgi:hypothetical protein
MENRMALKDSSAKQELEQQHPSPSLDQTSMSLSANEQGQIVSQITGALF